MLVEAAQGSQWSCCEPAATHLDEIRGWILMVLAMMVPFTVPVLRTLRERSYAARRWRVTCAYLSGYIGIWLLPLAIVLPLRSATPGHHFLLASLLCVAAAAWTFHPTREILYRRCHRAIPLRPSGWRADWDLVRQGAVHGISCVGGCLLLMLACTITSHHLVMMGGGLLLVAAERRMFLFKREPLALGSLALAAAVALLGWGQGWAPESR